MSYLAAALVVCVCALALATWDALRRALAAQVRQAELRVEAMRRADYDAATKRADAIEARIKTLAGDHAALEQALAMRGGRR